MRKIDDKLKEYGKDLTFCTMPLGSTFMSFQPATDELVSRIRTYASLDIPDSRIIRNIQSVGLWITHTKPLVKEEASWLTRHTDDLVSLSNAREYGWLDTAVEDTLWRILPRPLAKV